MKHEPCDLVAERLALGQPLAELAAHPTTCARCRGLADVSRKLGATRHEVDPGLGFVARMTVGAQERLGVRRRNRIVAGTASAVAASALVVVLVTRPSDPPHAPINTATPPHQPEQLDPRDDADVKALVNLADVERSTRLSADWRRIQQPLAPYRTLFKHVALQVKHEAAAKGVVP